MASRRRKRLSVWGVLRCLGLKGDHDDIIQHVFESASRQTLRSQDGEPISGDDFLVSVFEALGTTTDWPGCGTPEWERLRTVALRRVVARLSREGLLDAIAVESATDVKDGEAPTATDGEPEVETPAAKDENPDLRIGVQVFRSYIRRGQRNPDGWFTGVDRDTPYKVIVRWASQTCPAVPTESLVALLDGFREVRWWDDDGHILGGEMLRVLESELEQGCGHEQWMCVVSDFEDAIGRLRGVFEKLCLL